jgi:outer membrane lipoprotein SlyB
MNFGLHLLSAIFALQILAGIPSHFAAENCARNVLNGAHHETLGRTRRMRRFFAAALLLTALSGCGPSYSPDTYSANAVQQANKVEQGVVVGVRNVGVSAAGTVGTITGAAAGGIAGSQVASGPISAFSALGGSLVGGLAGSAVEHTTADTTAFEYIVRKANNDLVSVTQKDKMPLALGQKVLVIAGNQARVVPDYTGPLESGVATTAKLSKPEAAPAASVDTKLDTAPPILGVPAANPVAPPPEAKPGVPPAPDAEPADTKPFDVPGHPS